jgi:hypothetical protein
MPFYFSDPNHEDRQHVEKLAKLLPDLVKKHQINTLFVEFLYIDTDKPDLSEEFAECANGRRYMTQPYLGLVKTAKQLGLRVVGLSMPLYTGDMKRQVKAAFAFRSGGGFDIVASEIIIQNAQDDKFVVFLGAGHYRFLSQHIQSLELIGDEDKGKPVEHSALDVTQARLWTESLLDELMWKAVKLVVSGDRKESQLQVVTFGQRLPLDFPTSQDALELDWVRSKYPKMPAHRFEAIWKNFYHRTGSGKVLVLKLTKT